MSRKIHKLGLITALVLLFSLDCHAQAQNCGGWINYTPTVTNLTNLTVMTAQYNQCGKMVFLLVNLTGTAANSLYVQFTLPIAAAVTGQIFPSFFIQGGTTGGDAAGLVNSNQVNVMLVPWDTHVPPAGQTADFRTTGFYKVN